MFDHDAFLGVSKSFFHGRDAVTRSLFRHEEIAKHFQGDIDTIVAVCNRDEGQRTRLKTLLQALFPQATGDRSENEWKRDLRICDEMSFDKYFQVSTDPSKPSAHEVHRFIEVSSNRDELVKLLRQTPIL